MSSYMGFIKAVRIVHMSISDRHLVPTERFPQFCSELCDRYLKRSRLDRMEVEGLQNTSFVLIFYKLVSMI